MGDSDRHSVMGEAIAASPNIITHDWIDQGIEDVLWVWNERMHPIYKDAFKVKMENARAIAHRLTGGDVYLADPGKGRNVDSVLHMEIPRPIKLMMDKIFGINWVSDDRIWNRFRRRYKEGCYNPK